MIKRLQLAMFFLAGNYCLQAQTAAPQEQIKRCGTTEYMEYLKQQDPTLEQQLSDYNKVLDQWIAKNPEGDRSRAIRTIPLVFHIIYNTAEQNISDAQIMSQLEAVNADFARKNADTSKTPAVFKNIAGNPNLKFCLATVDPQGNPTNGIVRVKTTVDSFDPKGDKVKSKASGGDDSWDVTKYYNIWICNLTKGILGYGQFPTGTASKTYGYAGSYLYTGTTSNVKAPFNKGRTTTHEMGHTFNLNHIWGDKGQCGATDNVADTPPQQGGTNDPAGCNYGKPVHPLNKGKCTRPDGVGGASVTNSEGDMFMNYMDYTDDDVMNMFTKGQVARMDAVVNNPPYNKLLTSTACGGPSAVPALVDDLAFNVYPNPNEGNFNLTFSVSVKSTYKVEISNALGQSVYQEELRDFSGDYTKTLDIVNYGKGIYTVSISNDQNQSVKKLVVY